MPTRPGPAEQNCMPCSPIVVSIPEPIPVASVLDVVADEVPTVSQLESGGVEPALKPTPTPPTEPAIAATADHAAQAALPAKSSKPANAAQEVAAPAASADEPVDPSLPLPAPLASEVMADDLLQTRPSPRSLETAREKEISERQIVVAEAATPGVSLAEKPAAAEPGQTGPETSSTEHREQPVRAAEAPAVTGSLAEKPASGLWRESVGSKSQPAPAAPNTATPAEDGKPVEQVRGRKQAAGYGLVHGTEVPNRPVPPSNSAAPFPDPASKVEQQSSPPFLADTRLPIAADSAPPSESAMHGPRKPEEESSRRGSSGSVPDAMVSPAVPPATRPASPHPAAPATAILEPAGRTLANAAGHAGQALSGSSASHRSSGALLAALDQDPGQAAVPAGVPVARLVEKLGQAEMHIGFRTLSFGSVEVHTTVRDAGVGVAIGSEKGDLRSALAPEIPALEASFRQHELRLDGLRFLESSPSLNSGLPADTGSHGRSFQSSPRFAAEGGAPPGQPAEPDRSPITELLPRSGLNIHA
jgi:hypothetical protein